jgi:cbb3-type cytochrome oxidase subunit 3
MNESIIFLFVFTAVLGIAHAFTARRRDIAAEREAASALPFDEADTAAYIVAPQSGVIPTAQEVVIENPLPFDPIPMYAHLPFEGEPVALDAERAIRNRRRARS